MPVRRERGAEVRVFSGSSGKVSAPTKNHVPVTMLEFRLDPKAVIRQDLPADYNAFLVVLEGDGAIGDPPCRVVSGDVVWLTRGENSEQSMTAIAAGDMSLRALLYAGRPLREPVVARGPFVMNTEGEIEQAFVDYRQGRFGPA
jgi:redox-sensitive bicupin YhaK (pirin superfamily)